jgi:hypothetical protein
VNRQQNSLFVDAKEYGMSMKIGLQIYEVKYLDEVDLIINVVSNLQPECLKLSGGSDRGVFVAAWRCLGRKVAARRIDL